MNDTVSNFPRNSGPDVPGNHAVLDYRGLDPLQAALAGCECPEYYEQTGEPVCCCGWKNKLPREHPSECYCRCQRCIGLCAVAAEREATPVPCCCNGAARDAEWAAFAERPEDDLEDFGEGVSDGDPMGAHQPLEQCRCKCWTCTVWRNFWQGRVHSAIEQARARPSTDLERQFAAEEAAERAERAVARAQRNADRNSPAAVAAREEAYQRHREGIHADWLAWQAKLDAWDTNPQLPIVNRDDLGGTGSAANHVRAIVKAVQKHAEQFGLYEKDGRLHEAREEPGDDPKFTTPRALKALLLKLEYEVAIAPDEDDDNDPRWLYYDATPLLLRLDVYGELQPSRVEDLIPDTFGMAIDLRHWGLPGRRAMPGPFARQLAALGRRQGASIDFAGWLGWPGTPKGLAAEFRRIGPELAALGWIIRRLERERTPDSRRLPVWVLERLRKPPNLPDCLS